MPQDRRPNSTPDGAYNQGAGDWFNDRNVPASARAAQTRQTSPAQRPDFDDNDRAAAQSIPREERQYMQRQRDAREQEQRNEAAAQRRDLAVGNVQHDSNTSRAAAAAAVDLRTGINDDLTEAQAIQAGADAYNRVRTGDVLLNRGNPFNEADVNRTRAEAAARAVREELDTPVTPTDANALTRAATGVAQQQRNNGSRLPN